MEEKIGQLWHRLITGMAQTRYAEAAVSLREMKHRVGILFRALGGDGGLQVEAAQATEHTARRTLLQRLAGSGKQIELAWRDERSLRLPAVIDLFPSRPLNRDLYLWLAALAVADRPSEEPWFSKNQRLTNECLQRFPGLRSRYQRLVEAHLQQRIQPDRRQSAEVAQESAIHNALMEPGSVNRLPMAKCPPQPVPLWLHPFPPVPQSRVTSESPDKNQVCGRGSTKILDEDQRRAAEQVQKPQGKNRGLVTIRMENIFTWGGFLNLDRGSEDNDDLENAADTAKDMETLGVSRDTKGSAGKLRFDLDLPAAAEDDQVLSAGILLPEWDYKSQQLIPDLCRVVPMLASSTDPIALPVHLRKTARRLQAQFRYLAPARVWHRGQQDGIEIDLDAYLRFSTDRITGHATSDGLYRDLRIGSRDLTCLLLADLSLSTDTWIDNHSRVIDVIRDSLYLFAESLSATGDRFAIAGFSSRKRDPIRYHQIKTFDERYDAVIRGRIQAIKPGYYTRLGAGIRHSGNLLKNQDSARKLLLILTDGKPNDLDKYEGRHGIEDTRQAVREARNIGLQPFCVTIDNKANDYLPHIFGNGGYLVIQKPSQLPRELPLLYARLTA